MTALLEMEGLKKPFGSLPAGPDAPIEREVFASARRGGDMTGPFSFLSTLAGPRRLDARQFQHDGRRFEVPASLHMLRHLEPAFAGGEEEAK